MGRKRKHPRENIKTYVRAEGNNGGDYIDIERRKNGTIKLEAGSCCVKFIDAIVPVEFLTGILMNMIMEYNSLEEIIDSFNWSSEYKEELKLKIRYCE